MHTEMGTLVTETSLWHHGLDTGTVEPGEGHVDLDIHSLNLMPARYYLSLWITGNDNQVHDGLENCVFLDVGSSNAYGSGRGLDSRYGIVFFPQEWKLDGLRLR
jgi:hypothetical protein